MNEKKENNNTLSTVEKQEGKWLDRIIVVAAVVIVIVAVAVFLGKKSGKGNEASAVQQLEQTEPDYSYLLDNIEGSYDVRLINEEGDAVTGVARIKYNDIEGYDLIVYSEYSPITYHFKSCGGANLHSEQIGDGKISYEKDFEKTTITFTKEGSLCELTR